MSKIYYAVTKGQYSDYHIVAITEDKKKAKRIAKLFADDYYPAQVEEYTDDEDVIIDSIYWNIWFDEKGNVESVSIFEDEHHESLVHKTYSSKLNVQCRAKNRKDAIKIAAEMRAKYLAEENGL